MKEDLIEMQPDTPVYLFTGFLESGKTKFIQETLEDERFNGGERTLLIVCEEGGEEYDPSRFCGDRVYIRTVEEEEELTTALMERWQLETNAERVLVEYNGMWMLDSFYQNMPARWIVCQEFMFADGRSFLNYNTNMRSLVYDKLKSCELVVLNRFPKGEDPLPYHKIIRGANRGCDIAYEEAGGKVRYDDIEDPLPFDLNAPVIQIADQDYAVWYRDLGEELDKYDGKTVRFKGQAALSDELPEGSFIIGRQMMNCCAEDLTFAGLIVENCTRGGIENGGWVSLTASIAVREHPGYDRPGPVLSAIEVEPAEAAENEVATFY